MALAVKHKFISAKGDGTDATQVQPSNWNDSHAITLATNNLIGRISAGAGAAEEIPLSSFVAGLLAATDAADFLNKLGVGGFQTGDIVFTFNTAARAGWIPLDNGTIGSASSGASNRSAADCEALFKALWNNLSNTYAPVVGGRGGSADADWTANKKITLPTTRGRAFISSGSNGGGLGTWVVGQTYGEEQHQLTITEMPSHSHANSLSDPGHFHGVSGANNVTSPDGTGTFRGLAAGLNTTTSGTGITLTNASAGSNAVHNNMQPFVVIYPMIKL